MRVYNREEMQKYLELNIGDDLGSYALVTYGGQTEPIWITKHTSKADDRNKFSESHCKLKKYEFADDNDDAIRNYAENIYENDYLEEGIKNIKSMLRDGWLYEINTLKEPSFLPEKLDDITLVSEEYCLDWILNHKKN